MLSIPGVSLPESVDALALRDTDCDFSLGQENEGAKSLVAVVLIAV